MPIENPYAKRLPSDRIGRITSRTRTGGTGTGSGSRTPHPAAAVTAAAAAASTSTSTSATTNATAAASASSGRANSSSAAVHPPHQPPNNSHSHATAQTAQQQQQQTQQQQPKPKQPQQPQQRSIPHHARLPSRRVSFSAAEIVTVSELARCLPSININVDLGGDMNSTGSSGAATQRSVRFTGVVLHVDLPGRFLLVGDGAEGARPSSWPAGTSAAASRGRGRGVGVAGRGLGRGLGGGVGIGIGKGIGIPSTAKKTPLNRYARTGMGGSVGSGGGRGTGVGTGIAGSQRTSLGGAAGRPTLGGAGTGTGARGLGHRGRSSSSAGGIGVIGGSTGTGSGLLHTAKKRKLVYTGGKNSAAAAAVTAAAASSDGGAMATPRQGGLPSSSRRSFPGAATGTAIGIGRGGILRTPRTTGSINMGSSGSIVGSSMRPRPPSTLGPGAAALEVLRQQRMRGVTAQAIVAVDIAPMMPLEANVGWKVGDTVTVFGEVRRMAADATITTVPAPAATSTIASTIASTAANSSTADAPAEAPSEETTERPSALPTSTTAGPTPPSALHLVLSALGTNGRGVAARIIRNTNGTDVHLLAEALRLRRKHVRERCAGWPPTGRTSMALVVGVPGIGVEALTGKFHNMPNDEETKDGTSGE